MTLGFGAAGWPANFERFTFTHSSAPNRLLAETVLIVMICYNVQAQTILEGKNGEAEWMSVEKQIARPTRSLSNTKARETIGLSMI